MVVEGKQHTEHPTPTFYNNKIISCARRGDCAGAEKWLRKMMVEGGHNPNEYSINAVMNAHAKRGNADKAEEWLYRMAPLDSSTNNQAYPTLLGAATQAQSGEHHKQCEQASVHDGVRTPEEPASEQHMERTVPNWSTKVHPTAATYNTLIHANGRAGRPERAVYWFNELLRNGFKPNKHTFGAMLNVCAEAGDFAKINHYTELMAKFGLQETPISYNTLIKACAHNGDIPRAESLLYRMQEDGHEVSLVTYNSLIHTCTQAGDVDRAEHYVDLLENSGVETNLITYNSVINACATKGDARRAEHWLLRLIKRNITPNEVTYGTICKALARQGDVQGIEQIMVRLENSGLQLNEYFYASLISACGAAQPPDTERAEHALEELVKRGFRAQSVKRALGRVVGERRAAKLLESFGILDVVQGDQCDQQGQGSSSGPESTGSEIDPTKTSLTIHQQRAERTRGTKGERARQNRTNKPSVLASKNSTDENVNPMSSRRGTKFATSDSAPSSDSSAPKLPPHPFEKQLPSPPETSLLRATALLLSTPSPMPLSPVVLQAHGAAEAPKQVDGQFSNIYIPGRMFLSTASVQSCVFGQRPYSPASCIHLSL